MNIKKLSWNEYHELIDKLAVKIKNDINNNNNKTYKYIAGVEPDDMFIAVHLSHTLKIPAITDITLLTLLTNFTDDLDRVLIVSNVVQTGNTFNDIMIQLNGNFPTAVLFKDKNSKFNPTYCLKVPSDHIYFPWESCGIEE